MVVFEHRLVQVGSGAALGLPCLVWQGSGFAGFGVTLEQVGAGAALGLPWLVWRGGCWRRLRTGTPPTPKIWNRGLTGLALGVWVWVGSHTNCTGVVGCAWATSWPRESEESTRSSVKLPVELISEMVILERRLV